ncbi:MAG: carbamoyltransferase HypF [Actinomycetota bacterium]|nr:carbamoyltransferase HypF [Actinomycetota bacterium]
MGDGRLRQRLRIGGTVQGVGFRPFVYALASQLGLGGFVLNDSGGVVIEVEGNHSDVDAFTQILLEEPPPLASLDSVERLDLPPLGSDRFDIRASETDGAVVATITPDVATCAACLEEIRDSGARRYGYAFTNCTNCGPRFTITTGVPYDRERTTMSSFSLCSECKAEYTDPGDRRFHAQPIACPRCGPRLTLFGKDGGQLEGDPITASAAALREGCILAIKGLGGYHLACDATDAVAVEELRRRKGREAKPFAVMAPNLEWACRLAHTGPEETAVLASHRRPIVIVARRAEAILADEVAPANRYLGIMLPYTPLHDLLMRSVRRPIVLTSGNLSDEPIAHEDADALERLGGIADAFLAHDRPVHVRCDDSVVRVVGGREYPIRRSRGYAPEPLEVSVPFSRPLLAAGPELKHTFCLGAGNRAILSHHIGDLANWAAMSALLEGVEHFTRVFDVRPEVVAHDLHPEYLSTKWALGLEGVEHVGVQHHHAHIASCLADNRRAEPVIGLALDGTGYGDDGAIWGCEVLTCDFAGYRRAAHLRYVPLPGGAAAVREPWRMAAVYLEAAFGEGAYDLDLDFVGRTAGRWRPILSMAATGISAPPTSSAGRLFDAVAALCGMRDRVSFEGQAAAELEQAADPSVVAAYPFPLADGALDGVVLVRAVAEDLIGGSPVAEVAARFHNGLAEGLRRACERVRAEQGLATVALSGGSWQNLLLLERVMQGLEGAGFEVLIHRRVPPNDGGVALGQAVIAGSRAGAGERTPASNG